ncbi:uncharacterized protein Z518_01768 [Rhinocladiella mackenziei CBS 650.93]|uniref:YCII-related domain-containing protein n=1 Tax=Rhinocladiella mackenziei CBS 650.93 TaxID=1442369 RepID=A0A0D2IXD1_9EURO|nr:uncharacterized protein Z518_01768 [Rhinocladiella mackenziei CBS 650.93]KIX10684.1 hypothetical protein Z518_01768 [Rhinocladiella mackenziei CBS 650.93]
MEWLVHIPDLPNTVARRLAVRQQHLDELEPFIKDGTVVFGGATLSKHPNKHEKLDLTGSLMVVKADSEEKLMEFLKRDIYSRNGNWDWSKAQITPFVSAGQTPVL